MVTTRHIIIGVLVVTIGIFVTCHVFQSEERKVKKRFNSLAEWVSKDQDENNFTMTRKTLGIGTLFAPTCSLETHIDSVSGSYTCQEISSLATRGRLRFSTLSLRFYDLNIEFPEKDRARVILTAQLSGKLTNGEVVNDTLELESDLKKSDKTWLFTAFEVVEVLEK